MNAINSLSLLIQSRYPAGAAKRLLALVLVLLLASHCAQDLVVTTVSISVAITLVVEAWIVLDCTNGEPAL